MGAIEEALAEENVESLTSAAHTIKGALSVFAAEPARALAERIEASGRAGRVSEARDLYAELEDAVEVTEKGLDALLVELG
jgi:HPt (histidine-containing phosphotransfer) domain-containing protein